MNKFSYFTIVIYLIGSSAFFYFDKIFLNKPDSIYENLIEIMYILFSVMLVYYSIKHVEKLKKEVERSREIYRTLIDLSLDGIYIENDRGQVLDCNLSGHEMFGYTKEEMLTKSIKDLVPEEFAEELPEVLPDELATGDVYLERVNKRKDGTLFPTEINTKFVNIHGEKRLIAYVRDISDRKKMEERLKELSRKDELTGIYNRRYILNELNLKLLDIKNYPIAVAMVDLDNFKMVNDEFGHLFGDIVLKKITCILSNNIRKTDSIGRYGGEEFLMIFPKTSLKEGQMILSRLKEKVYSLKWKEKKLQTSFSAGIIELDEKFYMGDDRKIIKIVDELLYKAKDDGKNQIKALSAYELTKIKAI